MALKSRRKICYPISLSAPVPFPPSGWVRSTTGLPGLWRGYRFTALQPRVSTAHKDAHAELSPMPAYLPTAFPVLFSVWGRTLESPPVEVEASTLDALCRPLVFCTVRSIRGDTRVRLNPPVTMPGKCKDSDAENGPGPILSTFPLSWPPARTDGRQVQRRFHLGRS